MRMNMASQVTIISAQGITVGGKKKNQLTRSRIGTGNKNRILEKKAAI